MNRPVSSTYEILKMRSLNEDVDRRWVDWAIEMMEAGFESDNLYILAGIMPPYNQFELLELTNSVLQELGLVFTDHEKVIRNYVCFLIKKALEDPQKQFATLHELKDIYYTLDTAKEYQDFMLLYYAKEDLNDSPDQWYWTGATQENIDGIIRGQFQVYIETFEANKSNMLF